jgi:hypothetical protein
MTPGGMGRGEIDKLLAKEHRFAFKGPGRDVGGPLVPAHQTEQNTPLTAAAEDRNGGLSTDPHRTLTQGQVTGTGKLRGAGATER